MLFRSLAPGITGLLPNAVIKNSAKAAELNKLEVGSAVTLTVQSIDVVQRRISLAPEGAQVTEDTSWKKHTSSASASAPSMGLLGEALAAAMQQKKK